jgi:non-specific serine/threonine protein kinase
LLSAAYDRWESRQAMVEQPSTSQPYVFLSYATPNRALALLLADRLETAGIRVWVDRRDITGGSSWDAAIVDAIRRCTVLALLCSQAAMSSPNVLQELRLAQQYHRLVLPLLVEVVTYPAAMEYILAGRQWIELLDRPQDTWLPDVLRALAELGPTAPGAPQTFTVTAPPEDRPSTNLPAALTSFIGREQELAALSRLLANNRLVTLTGPGGTGKTRLALFAASAQTAAFPDGIIFVDLAPLQDPALVTSVIAQALGVTETPGQTLLATLTEYLYAKQLLLILDNFEQVVEAAPLLHQLLVVAPRLTLLVTSRVVLHLSGESEYVVLPLPVPDAAGLPSLAVLAQQPAVALFVQRAQAARAGVQLTVENAQTIAEIVTRLDGLPLAIELAAARVKLLSPAALLPRLARRLTLLVGGPRDLPARQQTLRDTIAWSYELLPPDEQMLFQRLAVFVGGWTLETATDVCDPAGTLGLTILDGLTALVDKSLVQQQEDQTGEPRFTLLETIREFGLERLDAAGERERTQQQHATAFLRLAEAAAPALEGPAAGVWLARLHQEQGNLRAALQWLSASTEPVDGLRLGVALLQFWFMGAHWAEGRQRLDELLAQADRSQHPGLCARALNAAGFLARYQSDYAAAEQLIRESLALQRRGGDQQGIADALANLGYVALFAGDTVAAQQLYEESLSLYRVLNHPQGIADAVSHLGLISFRAGQYPAARGLREECLAIWRTLGDPHGIVDSLANLGHVTLAQQDYPAARRYFTDSLTVAQALGASLCLAQGLEGFAELAAAEGQPARSFRLAGAAAELRETRGTLHSAAALGEFESRLEQVRRALGPVAAEAAYQAGRALRPDDAIAEALAGSAT